MKARRQLVRETISNWLSWLLSIIVGETLALTLPLLIPLVLVIGMIQLQVSAIQYINFELPEFPLDPPNMIRQINQLFRYNAFALMIGLGASSLFITVGGSLFVFATRFLQRIKWKKANDATA